MAYLQSGSSSSDSRLNWNLEMLVFVAGEKPENPTKKLWSRERTNKLDPHMASNPGFKPGPHWWEVSGISNSPASSDHNYSVTLPQ